MANINYLYLFSRAVTDLINIGKALPSLSVLFVFCEKTHYIRMVEKTGRYLVGHLALG